MTMTRLSYWSAASSISLVLAGVVAVAAPPAISQDYFAALRSGEVNQLREALDHGFSANARDAQGNTPLILAAAYGDVTLMRLLIERGADPNRDGGEHVDAFLGTPQTPLMLARRRGETPILNALLAAGATNATPDRITMKTPPNREFPQRLDSSALRSAVGKAVPPLQETSIASKESFVRHSTKQDCTSCHQQYLPMTVSSSPSNADARRSSSIRTTPAGIEWTFRRLNRGRWL